MTISIVLVDDHQITVEGLRSLIEKNQDMLVAGIAMNGREALDLVAEQKPQVVVIDVSMPEMDGIQCTRELVAAEHAPKVIALSQYSERQFVSGMLEAGAVGYLLKECAFGELAQAIRTVNQGRMYLSPLITHVVVEDYREQLSGKPDSALSALTERELEVLKLVAEGKSVQEIADKLFISRKTVETHRHRIKNKLEARGTADLTRAAIKSGLIEP